VRVFACVCVCVRLFCVCRRVCMCSCMHRAELKSRLCRLCSPLHRDWRLWSPRPLRLLQVRVSAL
jgi:hypothetical protein